mmetsp:Transcript_3762/g.5664  ORF Transcript_3762/g.5664 Transcript_3762/m.5664 type:complete len:284 (+) Transcript_3762:1322-2173(+)
MEKRVQNSLQWCKTLSEEKRVESTQTKQRRADKGDTRSPPPPVSVRRQKVRLGTTRTGKQDVSESPVFSRSPAPQVFDTEASFLAPSALKLGGAPQLGVKRGTSKTAALFPPPSKTQSGTGGTGGWGSLPVSAAEGRRSACPVSTAATSWRGPEGVPTRWRICALSAKRATLAWEAATWLFSLSGSDSTRMLFRRLRGGCVNARRTGTWFFSKSKVELAVNLAVLGTEKKNRFRHVLAFFSRQPLLLAEVGVQFFLFVCFVFCFSGRLRLDKLFDDSFRQNNE